MYIRVWESLVFKKQKWRKQKIRLDTGWGKKNRYKRHKRPKPKNPRMCYASLYVVLAICCLNGKQSSDVFNNRKLKGDNTPSSWKNVTWKWTPTK